MKKAKKAKPKIVIDPTVMSGEDFKAAIEKLYGTTQCQSAFARLISVRSRTVRSWIAEDFPVPKPVGYLVALMLKSKTKPEDLKL